MLDKMVALLQPLDPAVGDFLGAAPALLDELGLHVPERPGDPVVAIVAGILSYLAHQLW
jgi:hypothetical protein